MKNPFLGLIQIFEIPGDTFKIFNIIANFQNYIKKILVEKLYVFIIIYDNNIQI